MPNRVLTSRSPGGMVRLRDMIASIFATELMAPCGRFYLVSPRLSDQVILSSPYGQYRAIMSHFGQTEIRLGDALALLAQRGATVRVFYRPGDAATESFVGHLLPSVERQAIDELEQRALIGERFYLRGSLAFDGSSTRNGEESIELTTEPSAIAQALIEADFLWGRS